MNEIGIWNKYEGSGLGMMVVWERARMVVASVSDFFMITIHRDIFWRPIFVS